MKKIPDNFKCPICGQELTFSLESVEVEVLEDGRFKTVHKEDKVTLDCINDDLYDVDNIQLYEDVVFFENKIEIPIYRLVFEYELNGREQSQQIIIRDKH